jgi:hypothetical protein
VTRAGAGAPRRDRLRALRAHRVWQGVDGRWQRIWSYSMLYQITDLCTSTLYYEIRKGRRNARRVPAKPAVSGRLFDANRCTFLRPLVNCQLRSNTFGSVTESLLPSKIARWSMKIAAAVITAPAGPQRSGGPPATQARTGRPDSLQHDLGTKPGLVRAHPNRRRSLRDGTWPKAPTWT